MSKSVCPLFRSCEASGLEATNGKENNIVHVEIIDIETEEVAGTS